MYTYTFQMLCIELRVAHTETKFCQSCPHNKKGWTSLVYTYILCADVSLIQWNQFRYSGSTTII